MCNLNKCLSEKYFQTGISYRLGNFDGWWENGMSNLYYLPGACSLVPHVALE